MNETKFCIGKCAAIKPITSFGYNSSNKDKRAKKCKECVNTYNKERKDKERKKLEIQINNQTTIAGYSSYTEMILTGLEQIGELKLINNLKFIPGDGGYQEYIDSINKGERDITETHFKKPLWLKSITEI